MKRMFLFITVIVLMFTMTGCKSEPKQDNPLIDNTGAENNTDFDMNSFFKNSAEVLLADESGNNKVYSPFSMYLALSMLAEATDGDTREQIMSVLGKESIEDVRESAMHLYNLNYRDTESGNLIMPANSLWLSDSIKYKKGITDILSENYHASVFSGEVGTKEYNESLQNWVNEQTKGLLSEYANQLEIPSNTLISLVSTIYYEASWDKQFNDNLTYDDIFHSDSGEVTCEFMTNEFESEYFWSDNFTGTMKDFKHNGRMFLILPKDDVNTNDLVNDEEIYKLITEYDSWLNSKDAKIKLELPKFDISSDADITDTLKELGITDVFDELKCDFSPTSKSAKGTTLTSADHDVRISVDENGCEGAAFTQLTGTWKEDLGTELMDLKYDKPFIFVITSSQNTPLFAGVVNKP